MAPLWTTSTDFGGQPKGFQGSQQSTWLPTCLKSYGCFCAAPTLSSDDQSSPVCSCSTRSTSDPETKLSYFLHPHDLVSVITAWLLTRGNGLNRLDGLSKIEWLLTKSGQSARLERLGLWENNTGYPPPFRSSQQLEGTHITILKFS